MKKKLSVLVVCGGPSSEHEVSLKSAEMIMKNLDRKKYSPSLAVIGKDGKWTLPGTKRRISVGQALGTISSKYNFVFIAMHGAFGEDGTIQALFKSINMPYSGSGVLASAMAMDKHVSSQLYKLNGLRVPGYDILGKNSSRKTDIGLPLVVKPANGGSSVGVSIVKRKNDLQPALKKAFALDSRVIVQRYIKGRELTCGVIEKNGAVLPLPPTEIIPRTSSFFDYEAKYKTGGSLEVTPAKISAAETKEIKRLAAAAHTVLGCRGMSRSDFILSGGKLYILETNTIPGMTGTSLLPQAAKAAGISFPSLLDVIIAAGLRR